jgi:uncharacterized membrane protein
MTELSIWQSFVDPSMRHAMLVHLPIGLSVAALALAVLSWRRPEARGVWLATVIVQASFTLAAFATVKSGEAAKDAAPLGISASARELLHEHEELAESLPYFGLAMTILTLVRRRLPSRWEPWAAVGSIISTVAAGAWLGNTGHHGGQLVYLHGVGPKPSARAPSQDARVEFFRTEIEPLLAKHCADCHNAASVAKGKAARLDLTSAAGLLKGGKHAPAVEIGKSADSLLIQRVSSADPDEVMPPEGERLTQPQIEKLKRWIDEGLVWD